MCKQSCQQFRALICAAVVLLTAASGVRAADSFEWNKDKNEVSADVRGMDVTNLLKRVAADTGWQIFLEPGIAHTSSAKFKDLASGDALRMLLGDINFALVPDTNAASRLYVFRTAIGNATQQISVEKRKAIAKGPKRIQNELIVRLKPGANIDEIAKALGAKVVGSIPGINAYRLQFDDAAGVTDALVKLASSSDVTGVDFNYAMDRPEPAQGVVSSTALPAQLKLNPPGDSSGLVVGIVDTAVQPLGNDLDKFITKHLSVAGDSQADSSAPLHGTSMFESILRGMQSTGGENASAQFISVDVFGQNGETSTFDVASGIVLAVNNGANWINVSLGGDGSSAVLQDIVKSASDRGIAIFAAAGNDPTGEPVYPAAYDGVTGVTAVDHGQLAPYANMGDFVDVGAPGTGIVYYQNRPYIVQGTSVSTALTTGAAVGLAAKTGQSWAQIQPTVLSSLAVPASAKK